MANVTEFDDYRSFLTAQIGENKEVKAYRSKLAQAAGCQRSFFSQVLNSHVEFTLDHGAGLCEFLGFTRLETEYFLALIQISRASSERLRKILRAKLEEIRASQEDLQSRLNVPKLPASKHEMLYFSSWYWSAIHACVDSQHFQTSEALAKRLQISENQIKSALKILEEMELVKRQGQRWKMGERFIHLGSDSIMTEVNHLNWRQRALIDIQKQNRSSIHYSSVFTMRPEDFKVLKAKTLAFIDESRKLIAKSTPVELYSLNCDFFEV